ncbi:MAG: hypothetical protein RBS17_04440 [Coriobacteriia bacterium]|nr:hypothetical protein [Coriobacteriia bacterium]
MRVLHSDATIFTVRSIVLRATRATFALTMLAVMVVALAGCADEEVTVEEETSATAGSAMAGPVAEVNVSEEALASQPEGMDLSTPEAAVRAYLDWSSYAYRTAQSRVALPTMSTNQEVRVDSYIQYNIQQGRLLDQALTSITFGEQREDAERVHVPVKESWSYTYVSTESEADIVSGPHEVSYEATYTVIPQGDDWVVDEVKATALGTVE